MNAPSLRVCEVGFHVLNMRTRMPFKYGIASLSALPHLFVRAELEVDGRRCRGLAAEGLPPKWFTKVPDTTFAAELADLLAVIRRAADIAVEAGEQPSPFRWWETVHAAQAAWGAERGFPPLLSGLGTSLIERAALDGFCRATGVPFNDALRSDGLGLRLPGVHPELPDVPAARFLPVKPVARMAVRHTIGLADPLDDSDLAPAERIDDGLPQTLLASVRHYGLRYFKVKVCGQIERDLDRLQRIAAVLAAAGVARPAWTLDGNEQFGAIAAFREFWERFRDHARLASFRTGLIAVEQPVHRARALSDEAARELAAWPAHPPLIIDESDGEPDSLRVALACGYAGTSHKNCKGVFRGVAGACLLRWRAGQQRGKQFLCTSEDLASVGPVAMLQDLCVAAGLGIEHSERNGHHYFRGLSMFPPGVQDATLRAHPDLYERKAEGFVGLRIEDGRVTTASVCHAPFGSGLELDPTIYTPLEAWSADSL